MKRPGGFDGGFDAEPRELPERRARREQPERPTAPVSPPASPPVIPLRAGGAESDESAELAESAEPAEADGPAETAFAPARVEADVRGAKRRLKRAERSRRTRERSEQRRFTAHLRRRRRYWLAGIGAVAGLAIFVAVGVFTPLMAVREVRIVGAEQVDVAELQSAMSRFEGVPLALVSDQEVHQALQPFALIERYAIDRIPPQTLVLRIEEREAVIAIDAEGQLLLYDAAGVRIGSAEAPPPGVPVGLGVAADPTSPSFAAAAQVIRDLPDDLRPLLQTVEAETPQNIAFVLTSGTRVVWGGAGETQRKAVVLRAMLGSLGGVGVIDVSSPDAPVFQ